VCIEKKKERKPSRKRRSDLVVIDNRKRKEEKLIKWLPVKKKVEPGSGLEPPTC